MPFCHKGIAFFFLIGNRVKKAALSRKKMRQKIHGRMEEFFKVTLKLRGLFMPARKVLCT